MSARLRLLLTIVALAALAWLLIATAERALALIQRLLLLPGWLQGTLAVVLALLALFGLRLTWWLLRPARPRRAVDAPDRASLQQRISRLDGQGVGTADLQQELHELDRRQSSEQVYVALFGQISTGKSSLLRALAPDSTALSDVRGGTTRQVSHAEGRLADGRRLVLADVPGSREAGGEAFEAFEAIARQEALRAHAVIYLTAGELTRSQGEELRWLAAFGKPTVLALNKVDQWQAAEQALLLQRLDAQARGSAQAVVAISAGGLERDQRTLADGRVERIERQRVPQIQPLLQALHTLTDAGAAALEPARQQAVLAGLHQRTAEREDQARAAQAEQIVRRYARRAVVGAMAAVAPGSDLLIQGALATGLTRALAELYGIRPSEVEVEDFVRQARLTLRSGSSIVLAIAGNALKAFPGLGTLGGGVLHAFAYALIFDSLGRALAASLAERQRLDQHDASSRMRELLQQAQGDRLQQLVQLTQEALRQPPGEGGV